MCPYNVSQTARHVTGSHDAYEFSAILFNTGLCGTVNSLTHSLTPSRRSFIPNTIVLSTTVYFLSSVPSFFPCFSPSFFLILLIFLSIVLPSAFLSTFHSVLLPFSFFYYIIPSINSYMSSFFVFFLLFLYLILSSLSISHSSVLLFCFNLTFITSVLIELYLYIL